MSDLEVSVVISTRGRADHLANALRGVSQMSFVGVEIVVVADPRDDRTTLAMKPWSDHVKVRACAEPNLSMSRNIGIAAAAGGVIAFIDDDAVPHPRWLDHIIPAYRDPRIAAVGGYTIDNTGVSFQAKKTLCDRFGKAYPVSDWFDERPLCRPGAPLYPSLLGTNSTFRASTLRAIGGFDETFAYLLDETDVCLRLIDAGHRVLYEPEALVYHQYAPSHIRNERRIARTYYPSAVSTSYFIARHGAAADRGRAWVEIDKFRDEILTSNKWFADHGDISQDDRFSLDQDVLSGITAGLDRAALGATRSSGDGAGVEGAPFQPLERPVDTMGICLVSQSLPPETDAGIGRWTHSLAKGLADRGHRVHVVTRCWTGEETTRYANGVYLHKCKPNGIAADEVAGTYDLPVALANWSARVIQEIAFIKTFGLDVVMFPIWDLEALPCLDDPELTTIVTLQTTYALNKPFKPEWQARPIFEALHVDRVIAAERRCLERAPEIIAISHAIISDLERAYGIELASRCSVVPIGTTALGARSPRSSTARLRVTFVGRFERRKGFDIAAGAALIVRRDVEFEFVGGDLDVSALDMLAEVGATSLVDDPSIQFRGVVSREELETIFREADIVLMPSRYESFGIVAIEAMAAGAPVVALASGGLAEVVRDGVNGFAVPADDQAVAKVVDCIRRLDRDRALLARLGSGARASFLEHYTVEKMAERMETVYRRAMAQKSGRSHA